MRMRIDHGVLVRLALCVLAAWLFADLLLSCSGSLFCRRLDDEGNGVAVTTEAVSEPGFPQYKLHNISWKMPMDFLMSCDDFHQVPKDHPMNLDELFGSDASKELDANRTAKLLHAAADYRAAMESNNSSAPQQFWCERQLSSHPVNIPKQPRIAIVLTISQNTDNPFYKEFGEKSLQNKRDYAARHGYDFLVIDNDLAAPRHKFMGSIIAVMSSLRFYDWIFKMDLDTIIMQPAIKLETFLDSRFDMIGAIDCWLFDGIQAGIYFLRNTYWSHMFLLEVFTNGGKGIRSWEALGDQATIRDLIFDYWHYEIRNHAKVVSPRLFNIYMHSRDCPEAIEWEEGDFIVHTTGGGPKGTNKELYMAEFFKILEGRANMSV